MESLTPQDVQKALDIFNLGIQIRFFENSTATSQLAADEIGCQLGQIAKSICFIVDDKPVVVIASGDQRVDDRKVAALLGVSRKQVKFATAEQCIDLIGYAPGGVPPLGHRTSPERSILMIRLNTISRSIRQVAPATPSLESLSISWLSSQRVHLLTSGANLDPTISKHRLLHLNYHHVLPYPINFANEDCRP